MKASWDAALYDGGHAFVWQHGAALLDLLAARPGERVLDLGCGTGHLTSQIAQTGAAVVGLDASAEMLAAAQAAYPGLSFVLADARDFAFAEPFDAVFSNAALHWVPDADTVAARVRAALRPGGRFVAEFGGRGNVAGILSALRGSAAAVGADLPPPPWYFPSVGEYATLLEAAGLEVVRAELFDRPTPLQGPHGLRDWVRMFASTALQAVPEERREAFLAAVEDAGRERLCRQGGWVADYRRLRVVAVRPG